MTGMGEQRVEAEPSPAPRPIPGSALALLRAAHAGPTVVVTLGVALLTLAADLSPGRTALVVAAVLTGQLSIGWSNDLLDRRRDVAAGRTDKPLANGEVSARSVESASAVAVVATVVLSLATGILPGLVQLLSVAAGWAYNLGLKATVWSWVPYAVAFAALPTYVGLVAARLVPGAGLPWWVALAGALLGVGAHVVNVLPDLADDALTGVRGLPHRLGVRGCTIAAVGLLSAASVLVAIAPRPPVGPVEVVGLGVVAALVVTALVGHGRTAFRAAMAIALVDVVLVAIAL